MISSYLPQTSDKKLQRSQSNPQQIFIIAKRNFIHTLHGLIMSYALYYDEKCQHYKRPCIAYNFSRVPRVRMKCRQSFIDYYDVLAVRVYIIRSGGSVDTKTTVA